MKIAVIGLGYVGLPLAVAFGGNGPTVGFDLSEEKIVCYRSFVDPTGEVSGEEMKGARHLTYHSDPTVLRDCDVLIVAVPTPVDEANQPDLRMLTSAARTVGANMQRGAIVVFESTVYPGATEEVCVPALEQASGMVWKRDFNVGYSPERINPGDRERTLTRIVKLVAGDTPETLETLAAVYGSIVTAGVYRVGSIKVAEAAKVIENTQRDLNIALINELALIFERVGVDTLEVLEAAGTKWNFLPFRPGLVGGHCIGVDPYYLTHKAEMLGYQPQVILAGRRINDGVAAHVAQQTVKKISQAGGALRGAKIIVLGLAFKENCADLRNSKVADLVAELTDFGCEVIVHDPLVKPDEAKREYGLTLTTWDDLPREADAIVAAVSHDVFKARPLSDLLGLLKRDGVFMDIKSAYDRKAIEAAGVRLWRL